VSRTDELRLAWSGLHPERVARLVEEHGSCAAVLDAIAGGSVRAGDRARAAAAVPAVRRRQTLRHLGLSVTTPESADYPMALARVPDRPRLLFVRGTLPRGPAVAVVGTRRCTAYGRRLAEAYGAAIAAAGWVLVSGLARGIDGAAHRGTVAAAGAGVAVLGSGPDVWYPPEHRDLGLALVAAGGAVVSEYPPGSPPEPWRFPVRNRVISGMADAVVVVEAGTTGGALITAGVALEQGRPVFSVPGDVGREGSEGTNRLIRDGAHPVLDPDDLVAELSLVLGPPRTNGAATDEADVLRMLRAGPTIEEFSRRTGTAIGEALAAVSRLETAGLVRRSGDRVFPVA
jgi:DNA processing protein